MILRTNEQQIFGLKSKGLWLKEVYYFHREETGEKVELDSGEEEDFKRIMIEWNKNQEHQPMSEKGLIYKNELLLRNKAKDLLLFQKFGR